MGLDTIQNLYQQFAEVLIRAQDVLQSEHPAEVETALLNLRDRFQHHILSDELVDETEPAIASRIQSINIEIRKQLRLLDTDMQFLKAARQENTAQQRRDQMGDRLEQIGRYCEVVLSIPPGLG